MYSSTVDGAGAGFGFTEEGPELGYPSERRLDGG